MSDTKALGTEALEAMIEWAANYSLEKRSRIDRARVELAQLQQLQSGQAKLLEAAEYFLTCTFDPNQLSSLEEYTVKHAKHTIVIREARAAAAIAEETK